MYRKLTFYENSFTFERPMKRTALLLFAFGISILFTSCSGDNEEHEEKSTEDAVVEEIEVEDTTSIPEVYFIPLDEELSGIDSIGALMLQTASLGTIQIGMGYEKVIELAGEPESKSEMEYWEVDAVDHIWWYYADSSLIVEFTNMESDEFTVTVIDLVKESAFETERGIGIGSSAKEVQEAYSAEMTLSDWKDGDEQILLGEAGYGGLFFTLCEGRICAIKIGPILRC